MSITLKRQLTEEEKERVLLQHGRFCFSNGHPIPEGELVQFDHIKAYALDGQLEIDNIAPMCGLHNREKGQLSLYDFRVKLRLQRFFSQGDKLTLRHFLAFLKAEKDIIDYARPLTITSSDKLVLLQSQTDNAEYPLYTCPITGWTYYYATTPIELLDSDDDEEETTGLQPRYLIFDRVFELFRHFQRHPVLQPSIGRLDNDRIKVFDGQHKIASLLLNSRKNFECKIYVKYDIRLLNQTNIAAHDKYSQKRFDSSIMVMKLGEQFGSDFEEYKNIEDGQPKSEAAFLDWLRKKDGGTLTNAELNQRFRSFLFDSVLKDDGNKLSKLVSGGNRSTAEKPITIDLLNKSLFSCFLYRDPTYDNIRSTSYKRESEFNNMIWLSNSLTDLAFGAWDPQVGPSSDHQRKLRRMLSSKGMMAWAELVKDALCAKVRIYDSDEKLKPLYRDFSEDDYAQMRFVLERLVNWKGWSAPDNDEIDGIIVDKKSKVKDWFKLKGLTSSYLMGASE